MNSTFESNKATVQGGAVSYNYLNPNIDSTIFKNNSAVYGNDYAGYPARIGYANSSINDDILVKDVASGVVITQDLTFALLDLNGQVVNLDEVHQILITPQNSSISSVSKTNVATTHKGVATFDNLALIINKELRKGEFKISSKAIDSTKVKNVLGSNFQQKDLVATFRD